GFSDIMVQAPTKGRVFVLRNGNSAFANPRRYCAMTFYDYAGYRLSLFTREEPSAIVAYLTFKRDFDSEVGEKTGLEAALNVFWLERAQTAPLAVSLKHHMAEQDAYLAAIRAGTKA